MRKQKGQQDQQKPNEQQAASVSTSELPIIASAKTGLAGKDDALLRRVPVEYKNRSVQDVLDYLIDGQLDDKELPLADGIRRELSAQGSIVVINGRTANLKDMVKGYLVERKHELPDGTEKSYRELEIEVSAVQQGGLYRLLQ